MKAITIVLFLAVGMTAFGDLITNGGFETGDLTGWTITGNNSTPTIDSLNPHSGSFDALLGVDSGSEPLGDSAMYQTITGINAGDILSFWYATSTTDTIAFDWQDAYIEDNTGTILVTLFHEASNHGYQEVVVDLTPYVGQTIRIAFLDHEDGFGDDTSLRIDDVSATTPEPVSAGLCAVGLLLVGLSAIRRRKR